MKTLVIGYGSIGSRHVSILSELGCEVSVVSNREVDFNPSYKSLPLAIEKESPKYIVIANKTSEHYETLLELVDLNFSGVVLIEKPLFCNEEKIPKNELIKVYVAYNMRFHPLVQRLYKLLKLEKVISVQAYVGQYLPQWRPQRDYRYSYSSSKSEGGGVLRDLSHELDYLNWILGGWQSVTALGGHYSHLEIDSDDVFAIMISTKHCPVVTVQMNYLDRIGHREVLVNTDGHTIKVDFIRGIFQIDEQIEQFLVKRDDTYRAQHQAILRKHFDTLCTMKEGMDVMKMIWSIEETAYSDQKKWEHR